MNVRNCRKCGRVFNYVVGPVICQQCKEELEKKFQEVKNYVRENPGANIMEVSEACEVFPEQIRQWIREERLQFTDDSSIKVPCEGCGKMINSGRFCDKCKSTLQNGFREALNSGKPGKPVKQESEAQNGRNRMHFL